MKYSKIYGRIWRKTNNKIKQRSIVRYMIEYEWKQMLFSNSINKINL